MLPWQLNENDEIESVQKKLTYRMAWQVPIVYLLAFLVDRSVGVEFFNHVNGISSFVGYINIIVLYLDFQKIEGMMPESPWRQDSPIYKKYEQSVSWWVFFVITIIGVTHLAETYGGIFFIGLSILWGMYAWILAPMRMAWALMLVHFFWILPPNRK